MRYILTVVFLKLLLALKNPGKITITKPSIIVLPPEKNKDKEPVTKEGDSAPGKTVSREDASPEGKPVWEGLSIEVEILNGTLQRQDNAGQRFGVLTGLDLQAKLFNGSLEYTCSLASSVGNGKANASGFFNLPIDNGDALASLVSNTTLAVEQLDVQPFLQFAASFGTAPQGEGVLSGQWHIQTAGFDNLHLKGNAAIRDLQLYGGILGMDRPKFSEIELAVDVQKQQTDRFQINTLQLRSELLDFQGVGQLSGTEGSLQLDGHIQLPRLFTMFPHALRSREGLQLDNGQVDFSIFYNLKGKQNSDLLVECTSETLRGHIGSLPLQWDHPITAEISLFVDQGAYVLQRLQVQTPFAQMNGSGAIDNFAMQGWADLALVQEQLGQLIELPEYLKGKVSWDSSVTIEEKEVYQFETELQVADFMFAQEGAPGSLSLYILASGQPDIFQGGDSGVCDVRLDSWLGAFNMHAADIRIQPAPAATYSIDGDFDLQQLSFLLQSLKLSPVELQARGTVDLGAKGRYGTDMYDIDELLLDIENFSFQHGPVAYEDTHVQLKLQPTFEVPDQRENIWVAPLRVFRDRKNFQLHNTASLRFLLETRQLSVQHLNLDTGLLALHDSSFFITDFSRPLEQFEADVQAFFQVQNVIEILAQKKLVPEDVSMRGQVYLQAETSGDKQGLHGNLRIDAKKAEVKHNNKIVFPEQDVRLRTAFLHDQAKGALQLDNITLDSNLGMLQGSLYHGGDKNLKASVTLEPGYTAVSELVSSFTGKEIKLQGRKPFHLDFTLEKGDEGGSDQRLPSLHYTGELESLFLKNLHASKIHSSLELEKGVGGLTLQGHLNGGELQLRPSLDFSEHPYVLVVENPQTILREVSITAALNEQLLSRVHPLLGVFVQPTGTLSMRVDHLLYPIEKPKDLLFTSILNTSNVQVERNGLLAAVLSAAGMEEGQLQLQDSEIACEGKAAKVTCSPVRLLVEDVAITLTGSMSYGGELEYVFQIPVTKGLVGREAYKVLQGTVLEVPVSGTVSKPQCDVEELRRKLGELLKQTAGKSITEEVLQAVPGLWDKIFFKIMSWKA